MNVVEIKKRREKIIDLIREHGKLSTVHGSDIFNVSLETIRQDFLFLENKKVVKKIYGGAILYNSDKVEPLQKRNLENFTLKFAIAKKAMEQIDFSSTITIGLDAGSTVSLLSELLAERTHNIIVSNSMPVAQYIAGTENRLYLLGGEYNSHDMAFHGEQTLAALRELSLDLCFLGTSGVQNRQGICSKDFKDIATKREFIKRSKRNILLTDSSKFQKSSLIEVARWEEIDLLITDYKIPPEILEQLQTKVEVIIAHLS